MEYKLDGNKLVHTATGICVAEFNDELTEDAKYKMVVKVNGYDDLRSLSTTACHGSLENINERLAKLWRELNDQFYLFELIKRGSYKELQVKKS